MEPTTTEWLHAFQELNASPHLHQIVVHRHGDWSFVAERELNPKRRPNPKTNTVAKTYYKTKLYNEVTYFW
jgi:hypothetical protein